MKRAISALNTAYNRCVDYLFHISEILIIVLMLVVVADTALRYTVKKPTTWGFEFTEYSLIYITFLGIAWLMRSGGHVKMDVLVNMLKGKSQAYLNFIASVISIVTCIMLVWFGIANTIDNIQNNIMSVKFYSVPMFIFIIVIPITSFLLLIEAFKQAANTLKLIRNPGH